MTGSVPASPDTWWRAELPAAVPAVVTDVREAAPRVDDLVAGDAAVLRQLHASTCERFGAPADTAATFLVIWTMGAVANAVGATWALADAGLVVDPTTLRFVPGDDVPVAGVHLGDVTAIVDATHPWAGAPRVEVVPDRAERRDRVMAALVAASDPLVEAVHRIVRVGRAGLWNQVGDGLVDWLAYRTSPPVTDAITGAARELATAPARRWKATAAAWTMAAASGRAFAVQKGGCCLEYRFATADDYSGEDGAAFVDAFPVRPGERITCGTCSLRDRHDAEARQRFWIDRREGA